MKNFMDIVRWVLILPVSFGVGILSFYISSILIKLGMGFSFIVQSFWGKLSIITSASGIMGAIIIYSAYLIAPYYKVRVSVAFFILTLLLSGAGLFICIMKEDYWNLIGIISIIIGLCAATFYVYEKEEV